MDSPVEPFADNQPEHDFDPHASFDSDQDQAVAVELEEHSPSPSDQPVRFIRRRVRDDEDADQVSPTLSLFRRIVLVTVTLLLIFAILATTILPGILAAERNYYVHRLPPPTTMPRT